MLVGMVAFVGDILSGGILSSDIFPVAFCLVDFHLEHFVRRHFVQWHFVLDSSVPMTLSDPETRDARGPFSVRTV